MTEPREPREDGNWHLSKRISVETVVLLLIQSVMLTIFITRMDARIGNTENAIQIVMEIVKTMPKMDTRLVMLEDKQVTALAMIDRISKMEQQVNDLGDLVKIQSALISRIDNKLPDEAHP